MCEFFYLADHNNPQKPGPDASATDAIETKFSWDTLALV